MRSMLRVSVPLTLVASLLAAQGAVAARITLTGADAAKPEAGVAETSVPGMLETGGAIGSALNHLGVDFGYGRSEGYYSDINPNPLDTEPFYAFCGVSDSGDCDLATGIDGRIVLTGSSVTGATRYLQLEAGYFDEDSNPLLEVFDRDGALLDSVAGVRANAPFGQPQYAPLLFTVLRDGADISFFRFGLPGGDDYQGFGVNRITIESPTAVPIPGTLGLIGAGLIALGAIRRRTPA